MIDSFSRTIDYVRVSLTDLCNLRCQYCMPEKGVRKMPHEAILRHEELLRILRVLAELGVKKVRLTGGEPLVRAGIEELAAKIREIPGIETLAITTNGVLLAKKAKELVAAGVTNVNMSLDTLSRDVFQKITRRDSLEAVMAGLAAAEQAGFRKIKLNCVPMRGVNDGELIALARLAQSAPIDVRFIELMPIGCAYKAGLIRIPMDEVRTHLEKELGPMQLVHPESHAGPAVLYKPAGFNGRIGFIDAMEHKFCSSCNRIRLTADGFLKLCLASPKGTNLRDLIRRGASDDVLAKTIQDALGEKPKEHRFEAGSSQDKRAMYQVGG